MIRYIGLDVHKDFVEVCILDRSGRRLSRGQVICTRAALTEFAQNQLRPQDRIALESSTRTWAVVGILEPHVKQVVVSNPLKTKAIAEAKVKTDKVDAEVLAQLLRCNFLPTVWQPDAATRELRRLTSQRAALIVERTRIRNRIRGMLAHFPVTEEEPQRGSHCAARKLVTIAFLMLRHNEPYRYSMPTTTNAKLARLRFQVTKTRRSFAEVRALKDGDPKPVAQPHGPTLASVYQKEGLPPLVPLEDTTLGERRMLRRCGVTAAVRELQQGKQRKPASQTGRQSPTR